MKIKRRVISIVVSILLLLGLSTGAYAGTLTATQDFASGKVTIEGVLGPAYKFKTVIVQVIGPIAEGKTFEQSVSDQDLSAPVELNDTYFNQVICDKDGNYKFSYNHVGKPGNYYIAVKEKSMPNPVVQQLFMVSQQQVTEAVTAVNNANTVQALKDVFNDDEYKVTLNLNFKLFTELSAPLQENVYTAIINANHDHNLTYSAFTTLFQTNSAIQKINTLSDKAAAYTIAAQYVNVSDAYLSGEYNNFSETNKQAVFERLLNKGLKDLGELKAQFSESVYLQLIQTVPYADNITQLITSHKAHFDIDTTGYDEVKKLVNRDIFGVYFDKIGSFKTAFKAAIQNAQGTIDSGSGSGGGGGGKKSSSSVTIDAVPVIAPTPGPASNVPPDITSVTWAAESLQYLYDRGILTGRDDGKIHPEDYITREEFLKILMESFKLVEDTNSDFSDVAKNEWFYKYVSTAKQYGITKGINDQIFGIGANITRQDIVTFCYRMAEIKLIGLPEETPEAFADQGEINEYAVKAIGQFKAANIVGGNAENYFEPFRYATRAETAKIIYKFLMLSNK